MALRHIGRLRPPSGWPWFGALLVPAILLVFAHGPLVPQDDAFITYRYVLQALSGNGPVFNQGERVLGTTTPLLMGALAIVCRTLGTRDVVAVAQVLSALCWAGCYLLAVFIAWHVTRRRPWAVLVGLTCVLSPAVWHASRMGMEFPLFMLLILALLSAVLVEAQPAHIAALAAAVLLTRPDGIAAVLPAALLTARRGRKTLLCFAGVLGLLLGTWAALSLAYYGALLPHSMKAKRVIHGVAWWQSVGMAFRHLHMILGGIDDWLLGDYDMGLVRRAMDRIDMALFARPDGTTPRELTPFFRPLLFAGLLAAFCARPWLRCVRGRPACGVLILTPALFFAGFAVSRVDIFPWYLSPFLFLANLLVLLAAVLWLDGWRRGSLRDQEWSRYYTDEPVLYREHSCSRQGRRAAPCLVGTILLCAVLLLQTVQVWPHLGLDGLTAHRKEGRVAAYYRAARRAAELPGMGHAILAASECGTVGYYVFPMRVVDLAGLCSELPLSYAYRGGAARYTTMKMLENCEAGCFITTDGLMPHLAEDDRFARAWRLMDAWPYRGICGTAVRLYCRDAASGPVSVAPASAGVGGESHDLE